jgi:hypothetical protein
MSSPLFQQARNNLKVANAGDISTVYSNITTRLNKDFWDKDSKLLHRRQIGSYGRQTAIHGISDLDWPSSFLGGCCRWCATLSRSATPRTAIKGGGQVVVINLANFVVEVLPVFVNDGADGYRFADANNRGSWRYLQACQGNSIDVRING